MSKEDLVQLTDNPEEEVPYAKLMKHKYPEKVRAGAPPAREAEFDTVSRDHWVQVEAAHDAAATVASRIAEQVSSKKGLNTAVKTVVDGHRRKRVVALQHVTTVKGVQTENGLLEKEQKPTVSFEGLKELAPASVNGQAGSGKKPRTSWEVENIPVIVESRSRVQTGGCKRYFYNEDYGSNIPGGCRIEPGGDQWGSRAGTFCTPAYNDSAGERQMVTCGHVLHDEGSTYDKIYQPTNDGFNPQGFTHEYVDDNNGNRDAGLVEPDNNHEGWELFKYELAEKDNHYIEGRLNWSTIKYYEGNTSYDLTKQGARRGTNTGHITSTSEGNALNSANQFYMGAPGGGGDSGGPIFKEYDGCTDCTRVYIAGVNAWSTDGADCSDDNSGGNAMEWVEDYFGVTV
ncbi:hypothetical protein [Haloarchaeobius sp. DYHT-AS-18]|uniref:hypothetical protein n=1 Tax=Haloarchaeobius sp. DYHT-AS-18 TaxID=3446117 RepID=UPI003EBE0626